MMITIRNQWKFTAYLLITGMLGFFSGSAQTLHTYHLAGQLSQVQGPVEWVYIYHPDGRSVINLATPSGDQYILNFAGMQRELSTRSKSYFDRDDVGFVDSAKVVNGKYKLEGILSGPVKAVIVAKSDSGYIPGSGTLFLEPGAFQIRHDRSFFKFKVSGSEANTEYVRLQNAVKDLSDSLAKEVYRDYASKNPKSPIALWALQQFAGGDYTLTTGIEPLAAPIFEKLPVKVQHGPLGERFAMRLEISKMFQQLKPYSHLMDSLNTRYYQVRNSEQPDKAEFQRLETEMFEMGKVLNEKVYLAYAKAHPNSPAALYALTEAVKIYEYPDQGYVMIEPYFKKLPAATRNSVDGRKMQDNISISLQRGVGRVAPGFSQPDSSGRLISLESFRGRYVLVDFWASWCGPCRAESPNLVAAVDRFGGKGFTVLSVSLDSPGARDKWLKAVADDNMTWTNVADLKGWNNAAARLYGIMAVPANFLIDPKGVIVAKNLRGDELNQKLQEIFNQ